jgi:hypothetical protein
MTHQADRPFRPRSLVLALLAAAASCSVALLVAGLLRGASIFNLLGVIVFVVYFVGALVAAVVLGLPVMFVLRSQDAVNFWSTLVTGMAIGALLGWLAPDGGSHAEDVWAWFVAGTVAAPAAWTTWRWSERGPAQ